MRLELLKRAVRSPLNVMEKAISVRRLGTAERLLLPNFLGIGAQKAGTTWLYANLRCHHELYLPDKKELHYFDRKYHQKSLRSYLDWFRPGVEKVKGEITPAYSFLPPRRIRFIHKLMPDARLVFLIRNPIERAWSHAVMNLTTMMKRPIEEVRESEFRAHFTSADSLLRGDYATILDNWLAVYPREQLFIGFFENIIQRPRELLSSVFRHVGVSSNVDWRTFPCAQVIRPHNGSSEASASMPERHREFLRKLYQPKVEELHKRFGERVAGWL